MTEQDPTKEDMSELDALDDSIELSHASEPAETASIQELPPDFSLRVDYRKKRELGRGGMGVVYLMEKVPGIKPKDSIIEGRDVVVKVSLDSRRKDFSDIINEANALSRIEGPNVCRLEHVGFMPKGVIDGSGSNQAMPFLELEYLDGGCLHDLIVKHNQLGLAIPTHIIGRILYDIGNGLDQIYNFPDKKGDPREIIHRDLCPRNVGLKAMTGEFKIMDLGIATKLGSLRSFEYSGKPDYSAPEQLELEYLSWLAATGQSTMDLDKIREELQVTDKSDQWTAGLIGYILATGKNPFKHSKEPNTNVYQQLGKASEIRKKVLAELPPARKGNSKDEWLEKNLTDIVLKATAYSPEDRYFSHRSFIDSVYSGLQDAAYGFITSNGVRDYIARLGDLIRLTEKQTSSPKKRIDFVRSFLRTTDVFDQVRYHQNLGMLYQIPGSSLKKHPFTFRD